jgi:hypothetical protein
MLAIQDKLPQTDRVGRRPGIKPVWTATLGFGSGLTDAIEAFRDREGLINNSDAIRATLTRYFRSEGLLPPPTPTREKPSQS